MDQIFIQNPGLIVCGKPDMTQRERPQAFVEAEQRRIANAAEAKGATISEHVEERV